MKKNLGNIDRILRIIFALVMVLLYSLGIITGTFGYVMLAIGAILALTSLITFCPIYFILGINTCPREAKV